MTAISITDSAQTRQAQTFPPIEISNAKTIIPSLRYSGRYLEDILYSPRFPVELHDTKKKILVALNGFGHATGMYYPKQATIASKVGKCTRHVSRLLNDLIKDGFLIRVKNLFNRKNDTYFFLDHEAYKDLQGTGIAGQMSGETGGGSLYSLKSKKTSAASQAAFDKAYQDKLDKVTSDIIRHGTKFNSKAFAGKYIKKYTPNAIIDTLTKTAKSMNNGAYTGVTALRDWWGHSVTIINTIGPNYNEAEHIKKAQAQAKEELPDIFKALLVGIG